MENSSGFDDVIAERVKNTLINDLKDASSNFDRANLIRESGFVLVHENAKEEQLSSLVLDGILDSYNTVVTSTGEGSVSNYTDHVLKLLKKSRRVVDVAKWKPVITKEDVKKEDVLNQCAGKFEDCIHREVTDEALSALNRSLENKTQKRKLDDVNAVIEEEVNFADMSIFEKEPFPDIVPDIPDIVGQSKNSSNDNQGVNQQNVGIKASGYNIPEKLLPGEGTSKKSDNEHYNMTNPTHSVIDLVNSNATTPYPALKPKLQRTDNEVQSKPFIPHKPKNEARTNIIPEEPPRNVANSFRTAREELAIQNLRKYGSRENTSHTLPDDYSRNSVNQPHGNRPQPQQQPLFSYGVSKKSLGARRTVQSKFVPPIRNNQDDDSEPVIADERLKHIDPKMIELVSSEIMSKFNPVSWDDIAGLNYAKATIQEAVVWPMLRPDIFTGLRRPPRGILLFGPPGTGKTLIGKCIASQSKSTFFSISASSLTSKWIGDGEKMVRALFAVAAAHQPSVIFIDEVDSLLCQRSETEHESSRRLKTEFLVQLDGAMTSGEERILIVGATNRPQELDEAARRRFTRRLYIPLPEQEARLQILNNLLQSVKHSLTDVDIESVGKLTRGYSGADMETLCREASMEPIRSIPPAQILYFNENEVRPISFADFKQALSRIRASVSQNDLQHYVQWNEVYGSGQSVYPATWKCTRSDKKITELAFFSSFVLGHD